MDGLALGRTQGGAVLIGVAPAGKNTASRATLKWPIFQRNAESLFDHVRAGHPRAR